MNIIGHEHILSFFEKTIEHGRLNHAYCFFGPEHVGKLHVARFLAAQLVGKENIDVHPDVRIITSGVDEKTGKSKKNISVEQIREVRSFIASKPFVAKYKIVIIDDAHRMNQAASNALLKSLEEPAGHACIFIVSHEPARIPQTILSRCQIIRFAPLPDKALADQLVTTGLTKEQSDHVSEAAYGRAGSAIDFANNPEMLAQVATEKERFFSLFGKPLYEKIALVDSLFEETEDTMGARRNLDRVLSLWQLCFHDKLQTQKEWTEDHFPIYNVIESVRRDLHDNIHPRLLVEQILLAIP